MTSRLSEIVKTAVRDRAGGRCEYCRRPEGTTAFRFHIDHVRPLSHGGTSELDNLALACFRCNTMKGTNIASYDPDGGAMIGLFNPRTHIWDKHFLLEESGVIDPLTPAGRVTIQQLQLNDLAEVQDRLTLLKSGAW